MLHLKDWQGCQKGVYSLIALFLLLVAGCDDSHQTKAGRVALEDLSSLQKDYYALSSQQIRKNLEHLLSADADHATADLRTKDYYRHAQPLVWVSRQGVDERADTLLAELHRRIADMGFTERSFRVPQLERDMDRMHQLDFDSADNSASRVAARLEYNLTKAYLRYVMGQRFGFTNPVRLLNRLDARETDSLGRPLGYRNLFDVDMEHPDKNYEYKALRKVRSDSLSQYLAEVLPADDIYMEMKSRLKTADGQQLTRLLVNMDRRRWRERDRMGSARKYVVVNVPAYHLWGVSPDSVIDMRAACGAQKTKTPLLTSKITHMEVNPQWLIPQSIIKNDIARHAGDSSYFARHRYFVAERKSGQRVNPRRVSYSQLMSGSYSVGQEGGAGNALGRIIFRFPNNFSVFLHDTSSPGVFQRDDRGVSHGCVRVQRPFDLACFLFNEQPDEWTLDKLRITMGMKPVSERGQKYVSRLQPDEKPQLIRWQKVEPRVPLYITYYTLFPVPGGSLTVYPDVYGYDKVLAEALATYRQ